MQGHGIQPDPTDIVAGLDAAARRCRAACPLSDYLGIDAKVETSPRQGAVADTLGVDSVIDEP